MMEDAIVAWRLEHNDDTDARDAIENRAAEIKALSAEDISPAQLRQQCHIVAKQLTRLVSI